MQVMPKDMYLFGEPEKFVEWRFSLPYQLTKKTHNRS